MYENQQNPYVVGNISQLSSQSALANSKEFLERNGIQVELSQAYPELSTSARSSGNAFEYYPHDAKALYSAIKERADFFNLPEVSRFASAAVSVMKEQDERITKLERLVVTLSGLVAAVVRGEQP